MAAVPVTIRLPEELKKTADHVALQRGVAVSEVVREALELHLDTGRQLARAIAALHDSETKRIYLEDQIRVIADFVADHVGMETGQK